MKKVNLNKKWYNIPETWDELTCRQLVQVLRICNLGHTLLVAQVQLFKILTGIRWFILWWNGPMEIEDKLYLVDWVFEENTITKNLLPIYRGRYGPADNFSNLQVCEFIFTEQYYQQYKEEGGVQHLNTLIAILYRPLKKGYNKLRNEEGDMREPYNDNLTALYVRSVARWPVAIKEAILFWYEGCRTSLVKNNPDVFGGAGGDPAKYGLWSVMRGVAEKAIHGNINDVERMYVHVFMMELNELVAEADRIKAAYKNTGNG
ncbi:hypothetical protein FAM09_24860 [Niastella caeni]|uniref:Uncharacterized protein n=1 Tax=Niastella caeni TaxID=2569763 RepID=A0A4S8HGZ9_9BACT|nr:hypothetical protein [Niastella caeni]THU34253.1 hypothetical protein FAM09_24860 [Niastella caeni]